MKIDILSEPQPDVFKNRSKYILLFNLFLATAGIGVLLGIYAFFVNPPNADSLGDAALIIFAGSSLPFFIVGEKLRARRQLTPIQEKELDTLCKTHSEIQQFCQRVTESGRHIIFAEFEACQDYMEEKKLQAQMKQ